MSSHKANKYRRFHSKGRKPKAIYKRSRLVEILPSTPAKRKIISSAEQQLTTHKKKLFKKHIYRWKHHKLSKKSPKFPPVLHFSPKPNKSSGLLNFDLCSICTDEDWVRSTDYFGSFSSIAQNMEKYDFSDPS